MEKEMIEIKNLDGEIIFTLDAESLSGADLSGADLYRADLAGANLRGTNLSGADLRGTNLYNVRGIIALCGMDILID